MAIQTVDGIDGSLKKIRILQLLMPLQLSVLVYAGEVLRPSAPKDVSRIGFFLVVVAILNIWSVLSTRRRVRQRCEIVRTDTDDAKAVKMWAALYMAGLLGCLAVGLLRLATARLWAGRFCRPCPYARGPTASHRILEFQMADIWTSKGDRQQQSVSQHFSWQDSG